MAWKIYREETVRRRLAKKMVIKYPGCDAMSVTQINRHTIIHTVNKHVIKRALLWPGKIILLIAGQTDTHFHTPAHAAMV